MKIVRPDWERAVTMKSWTKGTTYALILITSPAKEKGQVFLKRDKEMWNWVPSIERMIKIPPSMMMQSWMGSDFTNDDLVKESTFKDDYTSNISFEGVREGKKIYEITSIPNPDAAVVWGKVVTVMEQKNLC